MEKEIDKRQTDRQKKEEWKQKKKKEQHVINE